MAIFRVHVVDMVGATDVKFYSELEGLFTRVCEHAQSKFSEASVYWWTDRPMNIMVNEPVVWLVPNKSKSMIKKAYAGDKDAVIPGHVAGMTMDKGKGWVSECYMDHPALNGPTQKAKMAFHELMHNKLQIGDALHGSDYGFGLNRELLDMSSIFSAKLDPENIEKMAPTLGKPAPQWMPEGSIKKTASTYL